MTTNKQLWELAEKAKLGSWFESGDLRYEDARSGYMHGLHHDEDGFIAAASPDRVLELLDENEALQSEYEALVEALEYLMGKFPASRHLQDTCAAALAAESLRKFGTRKTEDLNMESTLKQPDITHDQILAITTAYEAGVGKGHDAYRRGVETPNPWSPSWGCDQAWDMGYQEGKEQAARKEGAEQQSTPDVSAPVEALSESLKGIEIPSALTPARAEFFKAGVHAAVNRLNTVLAAHRQQEEPSHDNQ